jgi:hypothetical protein
LAADGAIAALTIGEQIKVSVEDLLEEFRAIAAAIKDDCDAPFPDQNAHLFQEDWEHLHQAGIGLGGDDEQRVKRCWPW